MDLRAESAADTQAERKVQVAGGQVSSRLTLTAEVEPDSVFRLPWLRAEGWRAKLRKAGDMVERARWEAKAEDLLAAGRARKVSIPDIVTGMPSSMRGSVRSGRNSNATTAPSYRESPKSVRWRDRTYR